MTLQQAYLEVAAKLLTDPQTKQRLDRAYDIVRSNGSGYAITKSLRGSSYIWHIHKASTSSLNSTPTLYTIDSEGCSCPDARSVRSGLCKHRLASMMIAAMETDK